MYTKSENTISNLLSAAAILFTSKNYADVTMVEVAETAEVTKGALYYHFPSKEALYLQMIYSDLEEKRNLFQRSVDLDADCYTRLRELTGDFLKLPAEKRALISLVRRDINIFKNPEREKLVRAYQAALPEQIEIILRDGINKRELVRVDPRLLSWMFVALVEVSLSEYAERSFKDHERLLDFVVDLFFRGAARVEKEQD